ncbi:MAG: hypothetical protein VX944_07700 [Myxococcota bacterium]|nr:hypothetical protein [Myxococcota bacterium]
MNKRNGVIAGRFDSPVALEGLAGPATERIWLGRTLGERVEWAFMEAGVEFCAEGPLPEDRGRFLIRSDVAVTRDAVNAFADAVGTTDARWEVGGRFGNFIADLSFGDDGPWLVYLAPGGPVTPERIAQAAPLKMESKERLLEFPLSEDHHGASMVELPISDRLLMPTSHWLQLLWANLLGLGPFLWRNLMGSNILQVAFRGAWAAMKAGSLQPQRIGGQLGRTGKRCRIHPSAVVEGSWLGDDVEVGANAVVRGSVLATGTSVEDLAMVEFSVLGPGARVQRQAMVKYSVLGARSAVGGLMQLGTLDRAAALKRTGVLMDVSFGQGVRVVSNGQLHPAPLDMAGVCVGAGSTVGAGVSIAAGRMVPAGVQIVPSPESLVMRIPADIEGLVAVDDGTLRPL